jgi:hypothetical protein
MQMQEDMEHQADLDKRIKRHDLFTAVHCCSLLFTAVHMRKRSAAERTPATQKQRCGVGLGLISDL